MAPERLTRVENPISRGEGTSGTALTKAFRLTLKKGLLLIPSPPKGNSEARKPRVSRAKKKTDQKEKNVGRRRPRPILRTTSRPRGKLVTPVGKANVDLHGPQCLKRKKLKIKRRGGKGGLPAAHELRQRRRREQNTLQKQLRLDSDYPSTVTLVTIEKGEKNQQMEKRREKEIGLNLTLSHGNHRRPYEEWAKQQG